MDQNQLLAFYYTVTLGSTVNAADKLNVTASWVNRLIKALEEEVGHQLFTKKGKHLILTPKGEIFLKTVKKFFAEYEHCLIEMEKVSNKMEGQFTLSLPPFISSSWFVKEIAPFIKAHPHISLEIKTLAEAPDLNEGKIDIDIRPLSKPDENIIAKYLMTYDIGLYSSKSYLQEKGSIEQASDLKSHQFISFSRDYLFPYAPANWLLNLISKTKQPIVIDCPAGILHAIENGLGIGPLPNTVANLSKTSLIPILPKMLTHSIDIYYTYPKALSESLVVNELYNYLHTRPEGPLKGRVKT